VFERLIPRGRLVTSGEQLASIVRSVRLTNIELPEHVTIVLNANKQHSECKHSNIFLHMPFRTFLKANLQPFCNTPSNTPSNNPLHVCNGRSGRTFFHPQTALSPPQSLPPHLAATLGWSVCLRLRCPFSKRWPLPLMRLWVGSPRHEHNTDSF
jgi:hypothetical protein